MPAVPTVNSDELPVAGIGAEKGLIIGAVHVAPSLMMTGSWPAHADTQNFTFEPAFATTNSGTTWQRVTVDAAGGATH